MEYMDPIYYFLHIDEETTHRWFVDAGYSESEALLLLQGGIRAIPIEKLLSEAWLTSLRITGIFNQYSTHADWPLIQAELFGRKYSFLLCDVYYRRLFYAGPLLPYALYGRSGITLAPFDFLPVPSMEFRVHDRRIPCFVARRPDDISSAVRGITNVTNRPVTLFRGQERAYLLQRPTAIQELLFGRAGYSEPSLLSAAVRRKVDSDLICSVFGLEIQSLLYERAQLRKEIVELARAMTSPLSLNLQEWLEAPSHQLHDRYAYRPGSGTWLRELLALCQHYGIPSTGLDCTERLVTALWFAIHRANRLPSGALSYSPLTWSKEDITSWPCIYILQPVTQYAEHFDFLRCAQIPATRPRRQDARLALGGWGFHQNVVAEDLMAIAFLHPDSDWETFLTPSWLFPGPSEDPFLATLLQRKSEVKGSMLEYFFNYVDEYTF